MTTKEAVSGIERLEATDFSIVRLNLAEFDSSKIDHIINKLSFLPKAEKSQKIITGLIERMLKKDSEGEQWVSIDKHSDIHFQCAGKTPVEQMQMLDDYSESKGSKEKLSIGRIDEHLKIISLTADPILLFHYERNLIRTETKVGNKYLCLHLVRPTNEIEIAMCGSQQGSVDVGLVPFYRGKGGK